MFAEKLGKSQPVISMAISAAKVHQKLITHVIGFDSEGRFRILVEIGKAPEWLWCALGQAAMEGRWTFETARQMVGNYKQAPEPPKCEPPSARWRHPCPRAIHSLSLALGAASGAG